MNDYMANKKAFFQKKQNQQAMFIALFVALMVLLAQGLSLAVEWTMSNFKFDVRTAKAIGWAMAVIVILLFIRKFEHSLEN